MEDRSVEIHPKKSKLILMILGSIGITALGIIVWMLSVEFLGGFLVFAGLLGMIPNLKTYLTGKPVMIIDENGITDRMNFPSTEFIAWSDIQSAEITDIVSIGHLSVYFHEPDEVVNRYSFLKKPFFKSTLKSHGTFANYRLNQFPMEGQKVLEVINHYIRQNG